MTALESVALLHTINISNRVTCLAVSNPVKEEVSHTYSDTPPCIVSEYSILDPMQSEKDQTI